MTTLHVQTTSQGRRGDRGGIQLFVEGSVIIRFKNKLLLCMNILDPSIPFRTSTIQLCNMHATSGLPLLCLHSRLNNVIVHFCKQIWLLFWAVLLYLFTQLLEFGLPSEKLFGGSYQLSSCGGGNKFLRHSHRFRFRCTARAQAKRVAQQLYTFRC